MLFKLKLICYEKWKWSCLVVSDCDPMDCSLPGFSIHGIFPGKRTRVGCHFLLQGIFPTQGSNPGFPHCRQMLYPLSHQGSPNTVLYCQLYLKKKKPKKLLKWQAQQQQQQQQKTLHRSASHFGEFPFSLFIRYRFSSYLYMILISWYNFESQVSHLIL